MRTRSIPVFAALAGIGVVVASAPARAITTPDVGSAACTTVNGGSGCFKMTNNNTSATGLTNSAAGTSITSVATGSGTAIKGFTDGTGNGVLGIATASGTAVNGNASSGTGNGTGVSGVSTNGTGVSGSSTNGTGITGFCGGANGTAISGTTTGTGTSARGVFGTTVNGTGVYGSTTGTGTTSVGVYGTSSKGYGVQATTSQTTNATALYATVPAAASGGSSVILADSQGSAANGVVGFSGSARGVFGFSDTGTGVRAEGNHGNAIVAETYTAGQITVVASPATTSDLAYYGGGGIQLTGSFAEKVGGGAWSAPSDRRIKKDVKDLDRGLNELMRVRPVTFKYNGLGGSEDDGKEYVGVIAQELEAVMPSMVSSRMGKLRKGDAQDTKIEIVDPSAFTYLLINGMKQQQRTIEKQDARIAELERRMAPVAASAIPGGGLGAWAALALLPLGVMIGRRRR